MKNPGKTQGKNPGHAETHAMTETLVQIRNRRFVAGIVLIDGVVRETAPILRFLKGWSGPRVWDYCARYGWEVETVREARQADMFEVAEESKNPRVKNPGETQG